jgi:hypothetical protein
MVSAFDISDAIPAATRQPRHKSESEDIRLTKDHAEADDAPPVEISTQITV